MMKSFSPQKSLLSAQLTRFVNVAFAATLLLQLWVNPSLAGDPFRNRNPHKIGDRTEAAFKAIFQQGDYLAAEKHLQQAISEEPNEPLAYAMKASLAYTNEDWSTLKTYSSKTRSTAEKLIATNPLRGNLYAAVGHFLEGALTLVREGTVKGAPQALSKLRQVYQHLDKAEAIDKNDPELNLLKGYMDLMLAVNLPFANPEDAIAKLEKNAAPEYLVNRGISLAYRDLKKYPQALDYANRALKSTAENPELYYLKTQILRLQANRQNNQQLMQEAIAFFDKALAKKSQLPDGMVKQIERERRKANEKLTAMNN